MKVKYVIEIEVDEVRPGDVDMVGSVLAKQGMEGLSTEEGRPVKVLKCMAHTSEVREVKV